MMLPSYNDRDYDLVFKQTSNFYDWAVHMGVLGLTPPSLNDTTTVLLKKQAYITATVKDLLFP